MTLQLNLKNRWRFLAVAPVLALVIPGAAWLLVGRDAPAAAEPSTMRLSADLSTRRLKMYEADTLVWQYPIAVGAEGYATPAGRYAIRKLIWNPRWVPPNSPWARKYTPKPPGHPANPMKVVKIFFKEPAYYIHGTGDLHSLGTEASHGCIRMAPEHVAEVARYVMEHGGQPREESWFWRIMHFRSQEKPIYLSKPITLVITR